MTTSQNLASSPQPQGQYMLTQAEHHALVLGFAKAMKFDPTLIWVNDSVLFTLVAGGKALIQADYTPLIRQPVTMAFTPDKAAIKKAKAIRGEGDVGVSLINGQYKIENDHTHVNLQAKPIPKPEAFTLPIISWLGVEVAGYNPKDVCAYIEKKCKAVQLAVYGDQLEQIVVVGADAPYTFTGGMAGRLTGSRLDVVLQSQMAFRFIGHKQSLRIGKVNGQYVLRATNAIDMGVDLVILEHLDVVSGR